jgi:hypothetical protein
LRIDDTQFVEWFIKKSVQNAHLKTVERVITSFMGVTTVKIEINGTMYETTKEPISAPLLKPNQRDK